jgi:hypothetical protein
LQEAGFAVAVVGVVGYPPYLKNISRWVNRLRERGYTANALRFGGDYDPPGGGSRLHYPAAYTQAETDLLIDLCAGPDAARENMDLYLSTPGGPKGRRCRAGMEYIYIDWDGTVRRCVGNAEGDRLGSIFEEVNLLTAPAVCNAEICPCTDLWQYVE